MIGIKAQLKRVFCSVMTMPTGDALSVKGEGEGKGNLHLAEEEKSKEKETANSGLHPDLRLYWHKVWQRLPRQGRSTESRKRSEPFFWHNPRDRGIENKRIVGHD